MLTSYQIKKLLPQTIQEHRYLELTQKMRGSTELVQNWAGASLLLLWDEKILFIKGSPHLSYHPNQVAFFGGRREKFEFDPIATATREFYEETSTDEKIEILGVLPPVMAASEMVVVPVVAKLEGQFDNWIKKVRSNGEWDVLFSVEMRDLFSYKNWSYAWRVGDKTSGQVVFFPLHPQLYRIYISNESQENLPLLWGASARMVWHLIQTVK